MANLLWGKVYYRDQFAGVLRQEPGDTTSFEYDDTYIKDGNPAIAHSLPLQHEKHLTHAGLPAFFDNLVAEGWLEQAQTKLLGKRQASRFELLLAFGYDCAGAVSIIDPERIDLTERLLDHDDQKEMVLMKSRASLSGVQPKLAIIERDGKFYPTKSKELSTHIAKFHSAMHPDLIYNEYLTMRAFQKLLPSDEVVEIGIGSIEGQDEPALIIKRFDRSSEGQIHFEEFNQLLDRQSNEKYDGAYKEMADFIRNDPNCLPAEIVRLYSRILAGILMGNTDMHMKNFAMFHVANGLRLTPSYDQVNASLYDYKTMALGMANVKDFRIGKLEPKHLILLGKDFGLPSELISNVGRQLEKHREAAMQVIAEADVGVAKLKDQLIKLMEKRWNGTFALIGKQLSKKP